jgi:hypothetical protein
VGWATGVIEDGVMPIFKKAKMEIELAALDERYKALRATIEGRPYSNPVRRNPDAPIDTTERVIVDIDAVKLAIDDLKSILKHLGGIKRLAEP